MTALWNRRTGGTPLSGVAAVVLLGTAISLTGCDKKKSSTSTETTRTVETPDGKTKTQEKHETTTTTEKKK